MAYSLLGLFDVNMPLLYGEGSQAFRRLQLQILEQSDDESILAWRDSSPKATYLTYGLLAESPSQFANCGRVGVLVLRTSADDLFPPMRASLRVIDLWTRLLPGRREPSPTAVHLCQLRYAQIEDAGGCPGFPVVEQAVPQNLARPCYIALKRRFTGDPFSRVQVSRLPWSLASLTERKEIGQEPEQLVCAHCSSPERMRMKHRFRL